MFFAKYLFLTCMLWLPLCAAASSLLIPGERQSFVFTDQGYFSNKPINVHYYKPHKATADAQIIFAIHGVERNGARARDNWVAFAEKYGFIVIAPEFDMKYFPNRLFQLGGMEQRDRDKWSFSLIEHLFDKIRSEENLTVPSYLLFGHSAGAQFVHRFVLMMDQPRFSIAIAANAGAYTLPTYPTSFFDFKFPWTLNQQSVDSAKLKEVFSRKLIVLLGEADLENPPDFQKSRETMAQGKNRLERGRNFYATAKTQAAQLGVQLEWQLFTVPGVGHTSREMSKAAAKIFLEKDAESSSVK